MVSLSLIVNGKEIRLIENGVKLQHDFNEFQKIINENKSIHIISEKDFKQNIDPNAVVYLYDKCDFEGVNTITEFKRAMKDAFNQKKLYKLEEYEKEMQFDDQIKINIDDIVDVVSNIVDANAVNLIKSVLIMSLKNIFSDIDYDETKYNKIGFAIKIQQNDQVYYYYNMYQWQIKFAKRFFYFGNYRLKFKFVAYLIMSGLIKQ